MAEIDISSINGLVIQISIVGANFSGPAFWANLHLEHIWSIHKTVLTVQFTKLESWKLGFCQY
jgi:hypothetical protein